MKLFDDGGKELQCSGEQNDDENEIRVSSRLAEGMSVVYCRVSVCCRMIEERAFIVRL